MSAPRNSMNAGESETARILAESSKSRKKKYEKELTKTNESFLAKLLGTKSSYNVVKWEQERRDLEKKLPAYQAGRTVSAWAQKRSVKLPSLAATATAMDFNKYKQ